MSRSIYWGRQQLAGTPEAVPLFWSNQFLGPSIPQHIIFLLFTKSHLFSVLCDVTLPLNCIPCHHIILLEFQFISLIETLFQTTSLMFCLNLPCSVGSWIFVAQCWECLVNHFWKLKTQFQRRSRRWILCPKVQQTKIINFLIVTKLLQSLIWWKLPPLKALVTLSKLHNNPKTRLEKLILPAQSRQLVELLCGRQENEWSRRHHLGLQFLQNLF